MEKPRSAHHRHPRHCQRRFQGGDDSANCWPVGSFSNPSERHGREVRCRGVECPGRAGRRSASWLRPMSNVHEGECNRRQPGRRDWCGGKDQKGDGRQALASTIPARTTASRAWRTTVTRCSPDGAPAKGPLGKLSHRLSSLLHESEGHASANVRDATAKMNSNQGTMGKNVHRPAALRQHDGPHGRSACLDFRFPAATRRNSCTSKSGSFSVLAKRNN